VGVPHEEALYENDNQDQMLSIKQFCLTNSIYIRYLKEEFFHPVHGLFSRPTWNLQRILKYSDNLFDPWGLEANNFACQ
jgi:hypothetical protein